MYTVEPNSGHIITEGVHTCRNFSLGGASMLRVCLGYLRSTPPPPAPTPPVHPECIPALEMDHLAHYRDVVLPLYVEFPLSEVLLLLKNVEYNTLWS